MKDATEGLGVKCTARYWFLNMTSLHRNTYTHRLYIYIYIHIRAVNRFKYLIAINHMSFMS